MRKYIKKKAGPKAVPGYRTPKSFRGKVIGEKKQPPQIKFNPRTFKVQHRG